MSTTENNCEFDIEKAKFKQDYNKIPSLGKTANLKNMKEQTDDSETLDKWTIWRHIRPECIENDASGFFYHHAKIRAEGEYSCIKIKPIYNASADIYFREDNYPTILDYNRKASLPTKTGLWIHCLSPEVMMKTDILYIAVKMNTGGSSC